MSKWTYEQMSNNETHFGLYFVYKLMTKYFWTKSLSDHHEMFIIFSFLSCLTEGALVALTMFRDHTFRYKYTPSSLPINLLQASRLYFQIALLLNHSSSDELGIVLQNCYAESKSALSAQNTDVVDSDFGRRIYFVKNRLFLAYNL